jgi:hypothetical protein
LVRIACTSPCRVPELIKDRKIRKVGFKKRKRLRRYDITASSGRNKRKPPGENKSKGRVKKKKKRPDR